MQCSTHRLRHPQMTSLPHKAESRGKGTNFICNFAFKIEKTAKNTRYSEKNVYLCGVNLRIE